MEKKTVFYRMVATARDPRDTGDMRSWFFFYKWGAGMTWVPAPVGAEDADVGDMLCFIMDDQLIGTADIVSVQPSNSRGERELHYDSDEIAVPMESVLITATGTHGEEVAPITATIITTVLKRLLRNISEKEQPQWLKNLLTS